MVLRADARSVGSIGVGKDQWLWTFTASMPLKQQLEWPELRRWIGGTVVMSTPRTAPKRNFGISCHLNIKTNVVDRAIRQHEFIQIGFGQSTRNNFGLFYTSSADKARFRGRVTGLRTIRIDAIPYKANTTYKFGISHDPDSGWRLLASSIVRGRVVTPILIPVPGLKGTKLNGSLTNPQAYVALEGLDSLSPGDWQISNGFTISEMMLQGEEEEVGSGARVPWANLRPSIFNKRPPEVVGLEVADQRKRVFRVGTYNFKPHPLGKVFKNLSLPKTKTPPSRPTPRPRIASRNGGFIYRSSRSKRKTSGGTGKRRSNLDYPF